MTAYLNKFVFYASIIFFYPVNARDLVGRVQFPEGYPDPSGTVVWIEGEGSTFNSAPNKDVEIDQESMSFQPYISVVTVGSKLIFKNSDPNLHMIKSQNGPLAGMQKAMIPTKGSASFVVKTTGVSELLCDIHSQMRGFVVAVPNNFWARTDSTGRYIIKNLPAPPFTVKVWNEVLPPASLKIESRSAMSSAVVKLSTW